MIGDEPEGCCKNYVSPAAVASHANFASEAIVSTMQKSSKGKLTSLLAMTVHCSKVLRIKTHFSAVHTRYD